MISSRQNVQLGYKIKLVFERQQVPFDSEFVTELTDSIDQYIQHVIGVIQSMISHYFEETQQKLEYVACYLRHDISRILIWQPNTVEFEGKIMFPYAHIRKEYIAKFYHFIINQLQLRGAAAAEYLTIAPINGFDTLIQPFNEQIIEMYGSTHNDDTSPLKLYEIYGMLNTDIKTTFDLARGFSPVFHSVVTQGIIGSDMIAQKSLQYWLPLFFSSGFYDMPLKAKEGMALVNTDVPVITMTIIKEGGETLTKLERARQLLNLISIRRIEEYWSWEDIGQALHSVDSGTEGLRLWKWITEQSDFKTAEDCESKWYNFEDNQDVDVQTLEHFASIDNPENMIHLSNMRETNFLIKLFIYKNIHP